VGPETRRAIDAAAEGRQLTSAQRALLREAARDGKIPEASRVAMLRALQDDAIEKRQLAALSNANGGWAPMPGPAPGSGGGSFDPPPAPPTPPTPAEPTPIVVQTPPVVVYTAPPVVTPDPAVGSNPGTPTPTPPPAEPVAAASPAAADPPPADTGTVGLVLIEAPTGPAAASGLKQNDLILTVGGVKTGSVEELRAAVRTSAGRPVEVVYLDGVTGAERRVAVSPQNGLIGVTVDPARLN
jgi:hypothetical protein